jgi:hypothetical protein
MANPRQTPGQAPANPPSPTRRTLPLPTPPSEFPPHHYELSIVPPRLIIYSNRVGLEPNLPLTRLPTHYPPAICILFPFFAQHLWSFTLHGQVVRSQPNYYFLLHLQFRNIAAPRPSGFCIGFVSQNFSDSTSMTTFT